LGIGPNPQSPIPNPQSPIPNPHQLNSIYLKLNKNKYSIYIDIEHIKIYKKMAIEEIKSSFI
jgi:hypothetical protein